MHWFDIVIVIIAVLGLVKGFSSGLVKQAASLAAILIGIVFAGQLSDIIKPVVAKVISDPNFISPISFGVAFLALFIAIILLGELVQSLIKAVKLNFINRLAGSIFCSFKWLFILSIILNIVVQLDTSSVVIKKDIREESHAYPVLKNIAVKAIPYLRFER